MELRKNESIFKVGDWHLAKWKVPGFLRELGGEASIDKIQALATAKYPTINVANYVASALKQLQKDEVVRQNADGKWVLIGPPDFEGVCYTCKLQVDDGQLCHRQSRKVGNHSKTSHRHVICARRVGVLKMSNADYRIWAACLKKEHLLYGELMNKQATNDELELKQAELETKLEMVETIVPVGTGAVEIVNAKPAA